MISFKISKKTITLELIFFNIFRSEISKKHRKRVQDGRRQLIGKQGAKNFPPRPLFDFQQVIFFTPGKFHFLLQAGKLGFVNKYTSSENP